MNRPQISNLAELELHAQHLKAQKRQQETELKTTFNELIYSINPISIAKQSLHELAGDLEVQFDVIKMGLNIGANLVIDKVLGKHQSIKGFLSSIVMEKLSTIVINNNATDIVLGITDLIIGKPKEDSKPNNYQNKLKQKHEEAVR